MSMTPEGRVKYKVKKILRDKDVWYYMPVQNGMGVVGIPDFICCYKGRMIAIECKAPGKLKNLTENQSRILSRIAEVGGIAIATDNPETVEKLFAFLDGVYDERKPEEVPE